MNDTEHTPEAILLIDESGDEHYYCLADHFGADAGIMTATLPAGVLRIMLIGIAALNGDWIIGETDYRFVYDFERDRQ